jgi:hypothetical protein
VDDGGANQGVIRRRASLFSGSVENSHRIAGQGRRTPAITHLLALCGQKANRHLTTHDLPVPLLSSAMRSCFPCPPRDAVFQIYFFCSHSSLTLLQFLAMFF